MTKMDLDPAREYRLELSSTVTDGDLARLAELRNVPTFRRLDISGCAKLTAGGFAHLLPLQRMDYLNAYGCTELTDAALLPISRLLGLVRLDLIRCKRITDAGLAHLPALAELEHLDLSGCEWVTDTGLVHLAQLPALKHVGLRNTQVTDAGAARLLRAIPGLSVDR